MITYKLLLRDEDPFDYHIGYFDPTMSNKPASQAFRAVAVVKKSEVTLIGAMAILEQIAYEKPQYR